MQTFTMAPSLLSCSVGILEYRGERIFRCAQEGMTQPAHVVGLSSPQPYVLLRYPCIEHGSGSVFLQLNADSSQEPRALWLCEEATGLHADSVLR